MKNGILGFDECDNPYCHIHNGVRRTCYVPQTYDHTIYFLGDSRVRGGINEDRFTIASFLQKKLNGSFPHQAYRTVNRGRVQYLIQTFYEELQSLPLKAGDVVFFGCMLLLQTPADSGFSCTPGQAAEIVASYLKQMHALCQRHGAAFLFFYIPSVTEIANPSAVEQYIAGSALVYDDAPPPVAAAQALDRDILFDRLCFYGVPHLDFTRRFQRPHLYGELFIEQNHLSPNGYKAVADALFDFIVSTQGPDDDVPPLVKAYEQCCKDGLEKRILAAYESDALDTYLDSLAPYRSHGDNGAIVMNCNPFTNGHRYLIETAAKQTDKLYVFVVQEDKSQIPFEDRLMLVKQGVADLGNVVVLQSGRFVLSGLTMPEYFHKETAPEAVVDCMGDLILFCAKIAPALRIKARFAGEEPYCAVTRQYNSQMRRVLPRYGIRFIEIPRLTTDGQPISASQVRRLADARDFKRLKALVPPATLQYLIHHR